MTPEHIVRFWLEETPPSERFRVSEALDRQIAERFGALWERALAGELWRWTTSPLGTLGFVVLCDQFPRNLFRGKARAFATDALARRAVKEALRAGFDEKLEGEARFFLYMPLLHSEMLADQERGVRRMLTGLPEMPDGLLHARSHREVIRRFGRFPYRNAALGRRTTEAEAAFLEAGGYGAVVRELQGARRLEEA